MYMTERWAAAKTAAITSMAAVRAAKTAAQDRIKASCGQDSWGGGYVQPWSTPPAGGYSTLEYYLTTGRYTPDTHWDCRLREVEALPALVAPWTNPERWESLWAEQQADQQAV